MIYVLPSECYESNTYLVVGKKAAVVDPGINPERVLSFLDERGLRLDYVINSHCHFDHTAADSKVIEKKGAKLLVHSQDAIQLEEGNPDYVLFDLFGLEFSRVKVDVKLEDGSVVDLGGVSLKVLHTPGHTKGSICLLDEASGCLFSGDTVFADGVGRTDFLGGNMEELNASLKRLSALVKAGKIKKVYPVHGGVCTGDEIIRASKFVV